MNRSWSSAQVVLCVAALATLQRAIFIGATRSDVVFAVPALDGAFYDVWARSLADGRGDFHGPYFLGPLYPYLVSFVYRIFGPDPWHVRLLQSLLGVAGIAIVTALGCRAFGRVAGAAAGLLMAGFGPLAFYEGVLVLDVVLTLLCAAALAIVLGRGREVSWRRAASAGLVIGLAALARPTALLLLPVAVWGLRRPARNRVLVLACLAACAVVVMPVAVRNARWGGGFVLTTNGGVNFWAGNNADARGRFHPPPGVAFFTSPVFAAANAESSLPPAVAARALTVRAVAGTDDAARSGMWMRQALRWMVRQPLAAISLWLRKAWLVLQAREVAQIESFEFQSRRLRMRTAFAVDYGWLWPLAALGLWWHRRRQRQAAVLGAAFAAAALLPCILFFVSSRYRLPAVPAMALLAGAGVAALVEWLRTRDMRRLSWALVALVPLVVVTRVGARPPRGAEGWEQAQMAERLYAHGDLAAALAAQERAAALLPDHPAVRINLALYWQERGAPGDLDRAIAALRDACRRWPDNATAHYNLGIALAAAGDRAAAIGAWRQALALDPGFQPARSRLVEAGFAVP